MLVVELFRCINFPCFVEDFEGAHAAIGPSSWLYNEGLVERKAWVVLVSTIGERVLVMEQAVCTMVSLLLHLLHEEEMVM
ncbi:unnamed protein product [Prunus armeniaca]|uniref:Uncharacterized protein n=1 Tax=Prunus armeniaca TaxID=36596 RepID=A0A6J5U0Z1_PRUAR|nr:unnamed protein product [Prunus armeniaca]